MDRPVNSTFTEDGKTYQVLLNEEDSLGYFRHPKNSVHCNVYCAFYQGGRCSGRLVMTGDCQPRYRRDKKSVYFSLCGV